MLRVVVIGLALLATASAQTNPDLAALQQVIEMHKSGDYAGAIEGYQRFLKAHPEVSSVRSNLGAALAHEGRFVRLNLALAYYKSARIVQALEQLEKVHQAQPENRQALLLLAASYLHTGQNKKIIELLDPVAKIGTKDLAFSYLLGSALIRDHQPERGQAWLDDILHNADSAEARLLMGTAKLMANDLAAARTDLTRAVELNPALPEAQTYLGLALLRGGDTVAAAQAFRKALAADPNDFDANLQLGGLLRQDQNLTEARSFLERALALRPGDFGVRYQLATTDMADGRVEQARAALESLVKEAPEFLEAHVSLATVYYRLKRKEDGDREREVVKRLNAAVQAKQPGAPGPPQDNP